MPAKSSPGKIKTAPKTVTKTTTNTKIAPEIAEKIAPIPDKPGTHLIAPGKTTEEVKRAIDDSKAKVAAAAASDGDPNTPFKPKPSIPATSKKNTPVKHKPEPQDDSGEDPFIKPTLGTGAAKSGVKGEKNALKKEAATKKISTDVFPAPTGTPSMITLMPSASGTKSSGLVGEISEMLGSDASVVPTPEPTTSKMLRSPKPTAKKAFRSPKPTHQIMSGLSTNDDTPLDNDVAAAAAAYATKGGVGADDDDDGGDDKSTHTASTGRGNLKPGTISQGSMMGATEVGEEMKSREEIIHENKGILDEAEKVGELSGQEEHEIIEDIVEAHELVDHLVNSESEMKAWGISLSVVGALFTSIGLLLQKIVNRNVAKDPQLGSAYCQGTYLLGVFFIIMGLIANTMMVGSIPMVSIAVLSAQAFVYTTILETIFIKEGICGFSMLTIFNLGCTCAGITLMLTLANISDVKYSPDSIEEVFSEMDAMATTIVSALLVVIVLCCTKPDEAGFNGYDVPFVGRVVCGGIFSAWYTVTLKIVLEFTLFFFRDGIDNLDFICHEDTSEVKCRYVDVACLFIALIFLGVLKVRYVVVILRTYHALLFLPLYQGCTFLIVALFGVLYFDELSEPRLVESQASLPWYLLSLVLVIVGVGSSGVKYDPHLHAITDDDIYDENEGLLDPYHGYTDQIFNKGSGNTYYNHRSYDDVVGDITSKNRNKPEPLDRGAMMFKTTRPHKYRDNNNDDYYYDDGGFEMGGMRGHHEDYYDHTAPSDTSRYTDYPQEHSGDRRKKSYRTSTSTSRHSTGYNDAYDARAPSRQRNYDNSRDDYYDYHLEDDGY